MSKSPYAGRGALVPLVGTAAMLLGLPGCRAGSGSHSEAITISANRCATGWQAPTSGTDNFEIHSTATETLDLQLMETGGPLVFAEIPTLGSDTSRPLTVTLGPGRYTWQCASVAGDIYTSEPEEVRGPKVAATPGYIPARPDDLSAAVDVYRDSVTSGLITLASATDQLSAAVDAGNLAESKTLWLVAHLDYERLGAAYDTFGEFDDEIDGRAEGLPLGVNDPSFTGFHRLEYGLWNGQPAPVLAAVANQLDGFVHGLVAAFPHQLTLSSDIPLRTHEILENALQFELTGKTDYGSSTNLATVRANVDGTQTTLDSVTPMLEFRNAALVSRVEKGLTQLADLLDTYRAADGTWTPVEQLTMAEREQLDGTIGALLEQLSEIPGTLRLFVVGAD